MNKLKEISKQKSSIIDFIKIEKDRIKSLPIDENSYIDLVTYARLLTPDILKNEEKALYLDCDLVILKDIKKLYDQEFDGNSLVAITCGVKDQKSSKERLGLKENDSYFNAGVLLMNLNKLRENDKFEKAVTFAATTEKVLELNDQDALNIVLNNDFKEVSKAWNYTHGNMEELNLKKKEIGIIHYTGSIKPWDARCENKYRKDYLKCLDLTPWKGYSLENNNFKNTLIREITFLKLKTRGVRYKIKNIFSS